MVTHVNDAFCDQYALKREEIVGANFSSFFSHDVEDGKEKLFDLFSRGILYVESNERDATGREMTVEGHYIVIYDEEGRISGHFGIQRDVTIDRENAAKVEQYIEIIDRYVIASQTDLNGIITRVSNSLYRGVRLQYEKSLSDGTTTYCVIPIPPNCFTPEMWETLAEGQRWHGEIQNLAKSGSAYWVEVDIAPLYDHHGTRYGYMAVRRDITARKKLEYISITDQLYRAVQP